MISIYEELSINTDIVVIEENSEGSDLVMFEIEDENPIEVISTVCDLCYV